MDQVTDLLSRQSTLQRLISHAEQNFLKIGAAKRTRPVIKHRLEILEGYWKEFKFNHGRLTSAATDEDKDEEPYFLAGHFDLAEDAYNDAADFLVLELDNVTPDPVPPPPGNNGAAQANALPGIPDPPANVINTVKLPRIELPSFSGNYTEWNNFKDLFESLIANNASLSNVQRLHYLKLSLNGEAELLLKNVVINDANYASAWNTLKERYDNSRAIINAHLTELFELRDVGSEVLKDLKTLRDKTNDVITALRNLGREVNNWDDLIVFQLVRKLDKNSRREWETKLGDQAEYPTYKDLDSFLGTRIRTLEAMASCPDNSRNNQNKAKAGPNKAVRSHLSTHTYNCIVCSGSHPIYQCDTFKAKPVNERLAIMRENKRCFNCFNTGHFPVDCKSKHVCLKCKKKHHTLLHFDASSSANPAVPTGSSFSHFTEQQLNNAQFTPNANVSVNLNTGQNIVQRTVLLATTWVLVKTSSGREQRVRALIDQGSEATLMTESLAQRLRAPRQRAYSAVFGIGDVRTGTAKSCANITLEPCHGQGPIVSACALILSKLTTYKPTKLDGINNLNHLQHLELADPQPDSMEPIHVLIGADLYSAVITAGLVKGSPNEPIAQQKIFGWVLSGPTSNRGTTPPPLVRVNRCSLQELNDTLTSLWEIEDLPKTRFLTEEERTCEDHFNLTQSRASDGKYIVSLPFKAGPPVDIGESYQIALASYNRLEKRLSRDPEQQHIYREFLNDYLQQGHMRLVTDAELTDTTQRVYLTHHPVLREDSQTTKLRVVFNASMPTSNGTSLNDHLLIGPKLQADIREIVLKWRDPTYVLAADIKKMFRQIWVKPNDTNYQLILFRPMVNGPIQTYRLLTVTYGQAPSPYLANRVIKQLADDDGASFPLAIPVLRNQIYVDDALFGADDICTARRLRDQTSALLRSGGFELRKWSSNCPDLLNVLAPDEHALASDKSFQDSGGIKLLGIYWTPCRDEFKFKIARLDPISPTKRSVLSASARMCDPLGWIAPVVIVAKMLMQQLWLAKIGWDDRIPLELAALWESYSSSLPQLQAVAIPRWTGRNPQSYCEIHGFADASSRAYAAVVYLKVINSADDIRISLILSKTKVAPIKTVSIPRLELCAASLLARTVEFVQNAMKLGEVPVYCWTDSAVTLAWIKKHPSHWKTFIANRVADIPTRVPMAVWRHVPTEDNPADCASRGVTPMTLLDHPLWWTGPAWLIENTEFWPNRELNAPDIDLEAKANTHTHRVHVEPEWDIPSRVSSWQKLLRVTVYVLRFIKRMRDKTSRSIDLSITVTELKDARRFWIKYVQLRYFSAELQKLNAKQEVSRKSTLVRLDPALDKEGVMRVGGRLRNSLLSYEQQCPILLPEHRVAELIIADCHKHTLHGGTQLMLRVLRQTYWILNARKLVKSFVHGCVTCVRHRAVTATQKMGDLPSVRVTPARPFEHSGIDYAGPFLVRHLPGRGHKAHKTYIALFICLCTRAIHLELVSDYSTETFLAAFERFASRRGLPSSMYSDNGTNFRGADKELSAAFKAVTQDVDVRTRLASDGTAWHFIPPNAPHFGGIWEAGVMKIHLHKIVGDHSLTFEEMTTLLCKIEGCLHSRPIAPLTDDLANFDALTPGHFLAGGPIKATPKPSLLNLQENRLSRWQLVCQMLERYWQIWSTDYLQSLQKRMKWPTSQEELKEGDLVLIKNSTLPPTKWELGRIIECMKGQDGHTRVVSVKTAQSRYTRPITQLCKLPVDTTRHEATE